MLEGDLGAAAAMAAAGPEPEPRSGRQERLENWVNRFV
jgi:xylose isomerase